MDGGVQIVAAAAMLVIALLLGVTFVDGLVESTDASNEQITRQAELLGANGEYVTLNDGVGKDETAYKTTGWAINLTGASDSFAESEDEFSVSSDTSWTVSVWGRVDSGSETESMTAFATRNVQVAYNGSRSEWVGWYYDSSSRDSWKVNVSAPNQPRDLANVQLVANDTHLTIYRNLTEGESVALNSNIAPVPPTSSNWDGRLEEFRSFDQGLDSSNRSKVFNNPVDQQPTLSPTSRIMFDQPDESTQLIFYTDTKLTQSNATFSAGFPEKVMQEGDFAIVGSDYKWQATGPKLAPIAGGELDGAPVVYVSYGFGIEGAEGLVTGFGEMAQLGALVPIIAIGLLIVSKLREA